MKLKLFKNEHLDQQEEKDTAYRNRGDRHAYCSTNELASLLSEQPKAVNRNIDVLKADYLIECPIGDGSDQACILTEHGIKICQNLDDLLEDYSKLEINTNTSNEDDF